MRADEKTYQLIEDYLNKELSGSEAAAFEKEMQGNPGLKQQVKLHQMANELVVENRLLQVKDILLEQKPKGGKSIWKFIVGGLAGALVLTGIIVYSNQADQKASVKTTAEKKSAPLPEVQSENKTVAPAAEKQIAAETPAKKSADPVVDNLNTNTTTTVEHTTDVPVTHHYDIVDEITDTDPADDKAVVNSPADPCHAVHLSAHVSANPACSGEDDGSILVNGFKGGQAPYHTYIYDTHNELKNTPLKLSAGTYTIEIKDAKGCSKKLENVVIAKKTCTKDYHFNPFVGESWNIPTSSQPGKLIIYNEAGNVLFDKEIPAGSEEHWSGVAKNGEISAGYFIFVIKYKDGSQLNGTVTIVQ